MNEKVKTPWTPEEVENLEAWQNANTFVHPFTYYRNTDGLITGHDEQGNECRLVPSVAGWRTEPGGPVVQDWAWDFMLDGTFLEAARRLGIASR